MDMTTSVVIGLAITLIIGPPAAALHWLLVARPRRARQQHAAQAPAADDAPDLLNDPELLRFFASVDGGRALGRRPAAPGPSPAVTPAPAPPDLPADPSHVYRAPILADEFIETAPPPPLLRVRPDPQLIRETPAPEPSSTKADPVVLRQPLPEVIHLPGATSRPTSSAPESAIPDQPDQDLIRFARFWFQLPARDRLELLLLAEYKVGLGRMADK